MRLSKDLISTYVTRLPEHIREYLVAQRGLTRPVIWKHQLGWNGSRIAIPIFDRQHQLAFFKLAHGPDAPDTGPKMLCWPAGECHAELYGWEHLKSPQSSQLVICEGEFDRLVLESHGIPAVTGTAGVQVFREEWARALARVSTVFVCFDRDEAGQEGAVHIAALLPHARLIQLPDAVGHGGDITDFFVRLRRSVGEFRMLMADAKPLPEAERARRQATAATGTASRRSVNHTDDPRVAHIKEHVPIEVIARTYVPEFRPSGRTLVGRCIFHADSQPSLVLYPEEGRFHCYGCGTRGDVIQFVMEAECWSFPKALRFLEKYLQSVAP